jgi:WD40 repeat protein
VRSVALLPDGQRFLTASADQTVRLWDLSSSKDKGLYIHPDEVTSVACLPDGLRFLSAGKDQTIRLWKIEPSLELRVLKGHRGPVFGLDVSRDGRFALSGGQDRTVRLWDIEQGKEIDRFNVAGPVHRVQFSRDGKQAVAGGGSEVWYWDLSANQVYPVDGPMGKITAVTFTASDRHILGASEDKNVHVWDTALGRQHVLLVGSKDRVWNVAASPDGKHAACCGADRTVQVYQLPDWSWGTYVGELRELAGHTQAIEQVAFTPDVQRLLSVGLDKGVNLWDVPTGKLLRRFEGLDGSMRGLVVLPDGKRAATASFDKTVRLWNLETGKEIWRIEAHRPASAPFPLSRHPIGRSSRSAPEPPPLERGNRWPLPSREVLRPPPESGPTGSTPP